MRLILSGILILAFLLRVIGISSHPAGFTADEASFGYDAYSLLKTGKDQWGEPWPVSFRSFGDFKLPLYTYLTIPSVAVFGLNEFAVRLPSALSGTLAVGATYLLTNLLLGARVGILASLLLTISPWHVSLSRGAFEANLTTFFLPFAVFAFLKGLRNSKWMVTSALFLGLNLFTYHSARFLTPIILFGLWWWKREAIGTGAALLHNSVTKYRGAVVIFLLFFLVSVYTTLSGGSSRAADIAIFNPTDKWAAVADRRYEAVQQSLPDPIARIFSNKLIYTGDHFITNYLSYFSPQFLFTQGAGEWMYGMIPGFGVLYFFELPFILFALWNLLKKPDKAIVPIMFWILISPIPAAITKGPGYAGNRVAVMMSAIQILSAYGAFGFWALVKQKFPRYSTKFLLFYSFTILLSLFFFIENYVYHAPKDFARGMLYGRREMMDYIKQIEGNYDEIVISRILSEPQIYVAFYKKFDPGEYQQNSKDWLRYKDEGRTFVDQLGEYRLGKYTFHEIDFQKDKESKNVLLVGQPKEFPGKIVSLKTINYPDGKPAILIVDPAVSQLAHQ